MKTEFIERRIISGLLMSDEYATTMREVLNPDLFESKVAKRVVNWCLSYITKYNKAPKQDIVAIYNNELINIPPEQQDELASIINSISDEYNETTFNLPYLVDQTNKFIKERTLLILSDKIKAEVVNGNISEAEHKILNYNDPTLSIDNSGDLFDNEELYRRAFAETEKPLFSFPGALGPFLDDLFLPDSFIMVQAPQKRGKTFFLNDVAMTALRSGCNVAYFQCGDLSENQFIRRLGVYVAQRHYKEQYCKEHHSACVDCKQNINGKCKLDCRRGTGALVDDSYSFTSKEQFITECVNDKFNWITCRECQKSNDYKIQNQFEPTIIYIKEPEKTPLTYQEAYQAGKKWVQGVEGNLKYSVFPMNTLTVNMLKTQLDAWERKYNFIPNVIIIDYFEIMFDKYSKDEYTKQDNLGKELRQLSQDRHCCVVCGTQAMASARNKEIQDELDSSECKKKDGHITGKITLNQTDEEKRNDIMRIGKLFVRDGESGNGFITITTDLNKGRLRTGSFFTSFAEVAKNKENNKSKEGKK